MATALVTYTFSHLYNDFTYTFHLYGDKEQRLTFALLDRYEGTTHS